MQPLSVQYKYKESGFKAGEKRAIFNRVARGRRRTVQEMREAACGRAYCPRRRCSQCAPRRGPGVEAAGRRMERHDSGGQHLTRGRQEWEAATCAAQSAPESPPRCVTAAPCNAPSTRLQPLHSPAEVGAVAADSGGTRAARMQWDRDATRLDRRYLDP